MGAVQRQVPCGRAVGVLGRPDFGQELHQDQRPHLQLPDRTGREGRRRHPAGHDGQGAGHARRCRRRREGGRRRRRREVLSRVECRAAHGRRLRNEPRHAEALHRPHDARLRQRALSAVQHRRMHPHGHRRRRRHFRQGVDALLRRRRVVEGLRRVRNAHDGAHQQGRQPRRAPTMAAHQLQRRARAVPGRHLHRLSLCAGGRRDGPRADRPGGRRGGPARRPHVRVLRLEVRGLGY